MKKAIAAAVVAAGIAASGLTACGSSGASYYPICVVRGTMLRVDPIHCQGIPLLYEWLYMNSRYPAPAYGFAPRPSYYTTSATHIHVVNNYLAPTTGGKATKAPASQINATPPKATTPKTSVTHGNTGSKPTGKVNIQKPAPKPPKRH